MNESLPEMAARTLPRFEAWWHGDVADCPPVTIMNVWRPITTPMPTKSFATARERALDAEFAVELFEAQLPYRVWIGDTLPTFSANLAADQVATLFGGELSFNDTSVWAKHNLASIRDVVGRLPGFGGPYWTAIRRAMDLSLERGAGRWLTGLPHAVPDGDVLVALRGPEPLCLDVLEDPEGVRMAMDHMAECLPVVYHDLVDRLAAHDAPVTYEGEIAPLGFRSSRHGCDFLALVPPTMARDTIYPSLFRTIRWLDRCYFHLDSAAALPHLDALLAEPALAAVQWVCGANRGPASKWIDVYRRIQSAGKAIELLPDSAEDALETMRQLRPQGVWIKFFGGFDEDQARWFIGEVAKRSNWGA